MQKASEKTEVENNAEELDNDFVPIPTDNGEKGFGIVSTKNGAVIKPFRRKRGEGETFDELRKRAEIEWTNPKYDLAKKQGLMELRETERSTTLAKPKPYAFIKSDGETIMVLDKSKGDTYVDAMCNNALTICKGGFDAEIYTGDKVLYAEIKYNDQTKVARLHKIGDKRK